MMFYALLLSATLFADNESVNLSEDEALLDRQIKYLIASNSGLSAYFDDKTIAVCPKCDYIQENISYLHSAKPHGTYQEFETHLLRDGKHKELFLNEDGEISDEWAIINYKIIKEPYVFSD
jgi:hypothetical protein